MGDGGDSASEVVDCFSNKLIGEFIGVCKDCVCFLEFLKATCDIAYTFSLGFRRFLRIQIPLKILYSYLISNCDTLESNLAFLINFSHKKGEYSFSFYFLIILQ